MIHCGLTTERSGMAAASGRKMKALILKMNNLTTIKLVRVPLIGKGKGTLDMFCVSIQN